jgi:hypothetical protein
MATDRAPEGSTPGASTSSGRTRSGFALTGPSVTLDPARNAVRPDLADIRLAGQVFAPHFAAPVAFVAFHEVAVTAGRDGNAEVTVLANGDVFEVLDFVGDKAWGIAVQPGLVGYVDRQAIEARA